MPHTVIQYASGMAFLVSMATFRGLGLAPLALFAWLVWRRPPKAARWLLLLPLAWIAALLLTGRVSIPYPSADQADLAFGAGYVALVVTGLIAPVAIWQIRGFSIPMAVWLALNLLFCLTTLAVTGLFLFST
jgi:hypothetical protein